ncbi:MAG: hypothetical protein KAT93_07715 [Desulfuromonadales bacterium]|nr:hypothetical protein [Desulfuromonadales bacterium]
MPAVTGQQTAVASVGLIGSVHIHPDPGLTQLILQRQAQRLRQVLAFPAILPEAIPALVDKGQGHFRIDVFNQNLCLAVAVTQHALHRKPGGSALLQKLNGTDIQVNLPTILRHKIEIKHVVLPCVDFVAGS